MPTDGETNTRSGGLNWVSELKIFCHPKYRTTKIMIKLRA